MHIFPTEKRNFAYCVRCSVNISSIFNSAYAIKSDGTVWAWGANLFGQLGDGTITNRSTPVQVKEDVAIVLTDVVSVSAGYYYALFLKSDGTVWSCGYNYSGQLGNGTTSNTSYATQVNGINDVVHISAGTSHSMAVESDGTAWAWGENNRGQLGDGTKINRLSPVMVNGLSDAKMVASGSQCSFALKSDGTVFSWGYFPALGVNSANSLTDSLIPVQINKLRNIKSITSGATCNVSVAITPDGSAWAWGSDMYPHLGFGDTPFRVYMPIKINEPEKKSTVEPYQFSAVFEIDQDQIRFLGMESFQGDENNLEWFLDFPWSLFIASLVPFITMVGMR